MRIIIDRNIPYAPYEQIQRQLRDAILTGGLPEGALLPSVREIMLKTGVSLATAQRAVNKLKSEGLILVKPGRGTYVSERSTERIRKIHIFLPSTHLSFFMEILAGINRELAGLPVDTVLHSLDTDKLLWDSRTVDALGQIRGEPAGVIFIEEATGTVREACARTAEAIPFVTIEWKLEHAAAILNNYRNSTHHALTYLVAERGSKKILVLKGRDCQYNAREKLLGIRDAAAEHGLVEDRDIFYVDTDFDAISGYTAVQQFLKREQADAVVCANDYEAVGVIGALTEAGLLAGRDVALIGYGDMTDRTTLYLPLTTVNQQLRTMGEAAVKALFSLQERKLAQRLSHRAVSDDPEDPEPLKASEAMEEVPPYRASPVFEIVIPALLEIRKT